VAGLKKTRVLIDYAKESCRILVPFVSKNKIKINKRYVEILKF
jgi:hypothetical protein